MKEIIVSVVFLLCELGALIVITAHGMVDWFSLILLVLIGKNIYVLYNKIKNR